MTYKHTNSLINETSPYLLQHAHNPVNWEAWKPDVLARAEKENKLLLISIGYAACHWCHVMEEECFENEEVAKLMNAEFINIKIDREERPDIDHIYMDALQMMTGNGGWPLNIIALPDGRPFWGATYLQKEEWTRALNELSGLYKSDPAKITEYAQNLAEGIKAVNLVETHSDTELIKIPAIEQIVNKWSDSLDIFLGGYKRAPKFMMPVNLNFLMHYGKAMNDQKITDYVQTTLTRMAWGGIFDHVGGGFSRYSVDTKWHVPHFEKMLYDNGQLISLYSQAYSDTQNELYKKTVEQTIDFVQEELMDGKCGFYSSLDADSNNDIGELEEGAYYSWTKAELEKHLGKDFAIFSDYYNINDYGLWERDNYVLIRDATDVEIAKKHNISIDTLNELLSKCRQILKKERAKRDKPRLDDKILTSWNGLMLKGLVDAYRYLDNPRYLELALENAHFINTYLTSSDGGLNHNYKNGKSTISGYLEDYSSVIEAYVSLYEVTYDEIWLLRAKVLMNHCIDNFKDPSNGLFYFTSKQDDFVIRRTLETIDNVVPSSNSMIAKNLLKLSKFFPDDSFEDQALKMIHTMQMNIEENPQSHANWLQLCLYFNQPFYEIAIVGENFKNLAKDLGSHYLPNAIIAAAKEGSKTVPILQDRLAKGETLIYVCLHGSCKIPVTQTEEVLSQMKFSIEH